MANTATKGGRQQGQQGGGSRERDGGKDQGQRAAPQSREPKGAGETRPAGEPNLGQKRGWTVGTDEHAEPAGSAPAGGRGEHGDRRR